MSAPAELRLWAEAIADPTRPLVGVLAPSNKVCRWLPMSEAIERDQPFFVTLNSHVFAVDFDQDNGVCIAQEIVEQFRPEICTICRSGQGDRAHLYLRRSSLIEHPGLEELCRVRGGDVRKSIRPPFAKHRFGYARSTPIQGGSHEMFAS